MIRKVHIETSAFCPAKCYKKKLNRLGYCSPVSFEMKYLADKKKVERFGIHC